MHNVNSSLSLSINQHLSNSLEWKGWKEFEEVPVLEVLTTVAEEVKGRLVMHHAVHALHPATSHRCIFPHCPVQRPTCAKEPEQQVLLLRTENARSKQQAKGLEGCREVALSSKSLTHFHILCLNATSLSFTDYTLYVLVCFLRFWGKITYTNSVSLLYVTCISSLKNAFQILRLVLQMYSVVKN